jgi:hypothetical protein
MVGWKNYAFIGKRELGKNQTRSCDVQRFEVIFVQNVQGTLQSIILLKKL